MDIKSHVLPVAKFTPEMKATHTILMPDMLSFHFEIVRKVLGREGYKVDVLSTTHPEIIQHGLRSVHNDTCYPALLVAGQFMDALLSGKYDTDKVALMIMQTGGGCRASNYVSLLRKALHKQGLGHIPVITFNLAGMLDKSSGFRLTPNTLRKMLYAVIYGDFMMAIHNQVLPYEVTSGESLKVVSTWTDRIAAMSGRSFFKLRKNCRAILEDFGKIERDTTRNKVKVGIVGEIYVKYAPLGNNELEKFLFEHNAEVINSGLLDFLLYGACTYIHDRKLYGTSKTKQVGFKMLLKYALRMQRVMRTEVQRQGLFRSAADFREVIKISEDYLSHAVKMGEGWLLPAEMAEYIMHGVPNIVIVQPFGCLPNHIIAKGMMRKIKDNFPHANIAAIDYDPGASRVNQENRLKLMLANAEKTHKK